MNPFRYGQTNGRFLVGSSFLEASSIWTVGTLGVGFFLSIKWSAHEYLPYFWYFVWSKEERLTLHQFWRKLATLMMFNTYDIEGGQKTEETQQHRRKRNRGDITDEHTLITTPPHAKLHEGKPKYKWNFTSKQKYQQLACSAGCKTQTQAYCRCNPYKWICKHCHMKHVVTVHISIPGLINSLTSQNLSIMCPSGGGVRHVIHRQDIIWSNLYLGMTSFSCHGYK